MANSIYVFRHGQTVDNRDRVFSGWRDSALTETGIEQAHLIAEKLKERAINRGYTSHLQRMMGTLKIVFEYHPLARIEVDERIIERNYGDLQGKKHEEITRIDPNLFEVYHRSYEIPPPNGESIKEVEARTASFCTELVRKIKVERIDVAVVAGNNSMRTIRRFFEDLSVAEMMKLENPYDTYFEYKV